MRGFGLGYTVNDNISLNVGQTTYGDEGELVDLLVTWVTVEMVHHGLLTVT